MVYGDLNLLKIFLDRIDIQLCANCLVSVHSDVSLALYYSLKLISICKGQLMHVISKFYLHQTIYSRPNLNTLPPTVTLPHVL